MSRHCSCDPGGGAVRCFGQRHRVQSMKIFHVMAAAGAGTLLLSFSAFSAEPSFDGQTLLIPRVDTPSQIGVYQDGSLRLNANGTWTISALKTLGQGNLTKLDNIHSVQLVATSSAPVSVYLKVKGAEGRCPSSEPLRVHQRRIGSHFEVNLSLEMPPSACPAMMYPYHYTVALDVYGLSAGSYSYTVNGVQSGTFALQQDNRFAEDCPLYLNCTR